MSSEIERPLQDTSFPQPANVGTSPDLHDQSAYDAGHDEEQARRLDAALHGAFGIDKLLNRLKQSVHSAKEFSSFLRERSILEDRHAQGYKRLVRHSTDSLQRPESRQGSFARNLAETLRINERIAENGLQLATALQSMSEELREVADNTERGRKHWKHNAIDAEKKVADAENAQYKARDRYNNAAEQYERLRTGEKQGGKFGLKNKSPAQQEEALKEKADSLDQEYAVKTQAAQAERREYEGTHKLQIVKALRDLVSECDAAVSMQLAKLASLTEKHVVTNGMAVAPIKPPNSTGPAPRGLRQVAADVDDRKDFADYMFDGVEAPPLLKGRSRRNTDAEPMSTPLQSTHHFDSQQNYRSPSPSPYNGTSNKPAASAAPQLPQIGGQDTFGSSFEPGPEPPNAAAPTLADPNNLYGSYLGQESGVTQDSLTSGPGLQSVTSARGNADPVPPPYDRNQPSKTYDGSSSYDRRPDVAPASSLPSSHAANPSASSIPTSKFQQRQGFNEPPSGPVRTDSVEPSAGPGPISAPPGPFLGRGGPAPGSYMDPGKQTLPYSAGRGQTRPTPGYGDHERQNSLPQAQPSVPLSGYGDSRQPVAPGAGQNLPGPAGRGLPSQQPPRQQLPPLRPVFGVNLDELFRRDGSAVPTIVFACIQAVDRFGLHTEGIYRVPGSTPAVMQLKSEFDHDSNTVQLTSPESFGHDISAVATLLKNFLRELPDSLLTGAAYSSFIQAAKYEDTIMRRDALHQLINGLPDPNYATLRVLILHLHGVAMNSEINKMDFRNLSIVFGPTVMGGTYAQDAGWQTKVMETILSHAHDVFDPDVSARSIFRISVTDESILGITDWLTMRYLAKLLLQDSFS